MATPRAYNTGLGTNGLLNQSDAARAAQLFDVGRGWQSLGGRVAATTSGITDLNDAPADVLMLPEEGRNAAIRYLGAAAGAVSAEVYGYPFDPGTQTATTDETTNKTDGNAAGELLATNTFTIGAKTADSPSLATDTDKKVSDTLVIDRQGYKYLAIRPLAATTVVPASILEAECRIF